MNIPTPARIHDAVLCALDDVNEQLPPARRLAKADTTALAGADGTLDSLGVVNLIAALEQQLERQFGTTVDLIDKGLLGDAEPLQSVGALVSFVSAVFDAGAHA